MRSDVRKQNKKLKMYIISGIIVLLVLIATAVTVFAIKKNTSTSISSDETTTDLLTQDTQDTQENSSQDESTEATTEEESTEAIPVSDEEVNKFFDENVNTVNEEPLPVYDASGYRQLVPYDGVARSVSCWGDSMTYGTNVSAAESYPSVLQNLVQRNVYNLGVPGETSLQIASRAGAFPMYTDRDITVKPGQTTDVKFISSFSNEPIFFYTDNSGYSDRSRPNNDIDDLCFLGDTPVYGFRAGEDVISAEYCSDGLKVYNLLNNIQVSDCSELATVCINSNVANSITEQVDTKWLAAQPATQAETTQIATTQPTTTQTAGTQSGTTQPATTQSETTQPATTQSETTQPATTQPSTTQPEKDQSVFIPAGTQVHTRASIERRGDILILEIGSNGGWASNYQELITQYNAIIDSSSCKYYIIVGDTDDPGTSIGDTDQNTPYDSNGNYIGIGDTAWEATLRKVYGDHFINMRVSLIQHGLEYTELDTTNQDLKNYQCGFVSKQLRSDWTHLNGMGYYAKARLIYEKGVALGYWN